MEYLMTYGWAILIIAVVMVALFSLGILGGNPLGTACLPLSGYICQTPVLHGTSFTVTIGQATGSTWYAVNVIWNPQGQGTPATSGSGTGSITAQQYVAVVGGLASGATSSVTFTFSAGSSAVTGTTYAGTLWASYATASSGAGSYVAQMATATLKGV
jgi:hypothetical protein